MSKSRIDSDDLHYIINRGLFDTAKLRAAHDKAGKKKFFISKGDDVFQEEAVYKRTLEDIQTASGKFEKFNKADRFQAFAWLSGYRSAIDAGLTIGLNDAYSWDFGDEEEGDNRDSEIDLNFNFEDEKDDKEESESDGDDFAGFYGEFS